MIAAIGSALVWVLIVLVALLAVFCAVIGLIVIINFPTKFR